MRRRLGAALAAGSLGALLPAQPAAGEIPGADLVGGWALDRLTEQIATWVAEGLASLVDGLASFLGQSSTPDVTGVWFSGPGSPYAAVRTVAGALLVGFVLAGIISGLVHGDAGGMVRRMALGLPTAVLAIGATTVFTAKLLALTDAMSAAVLGPTLATADGPLARLLAAATAASGGFAAVVVAFVGILAALVVWVELLVRAALVHLLVALSPIAFAATVWPAARGAARRLIELLLAVICSKFVIAVALAVGAAALGPGTSPLIDSASGRSGPAGLGALIVGVSVLALAAFAPFLVLRLFPVAEAAVVAQGISRGPVRSAQTAVGLASSASAVTRLAGAGPAAAPVGRLATDALAGAPPPPVPPPSATGALGAGPRTPDRG